MYIVPLLSHSTEQLEAFEEYLPRADSNSAATVTLVATGVHPSYSIESHSQSACAWERDHVALQTIVTSLQGSEAAGIEGNRIGYSTRK